MWSVPHAGLTFVYLEVLLNFHRWALAWENPGLLPEPLLYCHDHQYAVLAIRHFWYQLTVTQSRLPMPNDA